MQKYMQTYMCTFAMVMITGSIVCFSSVSLYRVYEIINHFKSLSNQLENNQTKSSCWTLLSRGSLKRERKTGGFFFPTQDTWWGHCWWQTGTSLGEGCGGLTGRILHLAPSNFQAGILRGCSDGLGKISVSEKGAIRGTNTGAPTRNVVLFGGWAPAIDHGPRDRALKVPHTGGWGLLKATQQEPSGLHFGHFHVSLVFLLFWSICIHVGDERSWNVAVSMRRGDWPWWRRGTHGLPPAGRWKERGTAQLATQDTERWIIYPEVEADGGEQRLLTKTMWRREGVFQLTVQSYSLSRQRSQGSQGLRQLPTRYHNQEAEGKGMGAVPQLLFFTYIVQGPIQGMASPTVGEAFHPN